jgi:uncharacterized protein YlxW (UPF0749 family)
MTDHRQTGTGWPTDPSAPDAAVEPHPVVPRPAVPTGADHRPASDEDVTAGLTASPDEDVTVVVALPTPSADDEPTVVVPSGLGAEPPADPSDPSGPTTGPMAALPTPDETPPATGGTDPGTGPAPPGAGPAAAETGPDPDGGASGPAAGAGSDGPPVQRAAPWQRLSSAGALIWVLIALFGFTLVVQLRSNDTDEGLATARQEDLVRILSDLEAREQRLGDEITTLESTQRQLTSGVQGRQAALQEAAKRANELGLLAGTLEARGPGLLITISPGKDPITASAILNAVQELRGAGGEVMQLAGTGSPPVRVVASTSFVDSDGAVLVDGARLTGPYLLTVIGDPQTMKTALNIPGGVVASVGKDGGTVIPEERKTVDVTAVREATDLQYARPVS